jgi:hypothetical protein
VLDAYSRHFRDIEGSGSLSKAGRYRHHRQHKRHALDAAHSSNASSQHFRGASSLEAIPGRFATTIDSHGIDGHQQLQLEAARGIAPQAPRHIVRAPLQEDDDAVAPSPSGRVIPCFSHIDDSTQSVRLERIAEENGAEVRASSNSATGSL